MRAHPEIEALLAELLDSGVSPKYVSRLASELQDHRADLEAEARRFGVPESVVAEDARLRLGASTAIASEFAVRPELRSRHHGGRWLRRAARATACASIVLIAPARAVASGHGAVLRYTAAATAGAGITFSILLMLTALMPPDGGWSNTIVEHVAMTSWAADGRLRASRTDNADYRPRSTAGAPAETAEPDRPHREPPQGEAPAKRARTTRPAPPSGLPLPERPAPSPPVQVAATLPPPEYPEARAFMAEIVPSIRFGAAGQEFRRVADVEPEYPSLAARLGVEGYVVVEYTVTRTGAVREAVVVESSSKLFDRAAIEAAYGLRYTPRLIQGRPVAVEGVRTIVRFELEV